MVHLKIWDKLAVLFSWSCAVYVYLRQERMMNSRNHEDYKLSQETCQQVKWTVQIKEKNPTTVGTVRYGTVVRRKM